MYLCNSNERLYRGIGIFTISKDVSKNLIQESQTKNREKDIFNISFRFFVSYVLRSVLGLGEFECV